MLTRIKSDTEELLKLAFEHYYLLSSSARKGILDGACSPPPGLHEFPPLALVAGVQLFVTMRDVFHPSDVEWLSDRFRVAAKGRWGRLASLCDDGSASQQVWRRRQLGLVAAGLRLTLRVVPVPHAGRLLAADDGHGAAAAEPACHARPGLAGGQGQPALLQAAARGGCHAAGALLALVCTHASACVPYTVPCARLAHARMLMPACQRAQDLEFDRQLQDVPGLLPSSLNLPWITAAEYCINFVVQLRTVLGQCPPNQPTDMAIELLVGVAQLQR